MTISQNEFQKGILRMSFDGLKNLLKELYQLIHEKADKIPQEIIFDLERKQTKIWSELQRRKKLNINTNKEFMDWLYNSYRRKTH